MAGYTDGMIGTTPVGNEYVFSGTAISWLYPWPVSLLSWRSMPLSVLLNAGRYECPWRNLALLLFAEEGFGKLLENSSSFVGISTSLGMIDFFPLSRTVGCFACPLSCMSPLPRLCLFSTWAHR